MYQMLSVAKEKFNVTIILIEQNIAKAIDFCYTSFLIGQGAVIGEFKNEEITVIEEIMFKNKVKEL